MDRKKYAYFIYNGKDSRNFGLKIKNNFSFPLPKKKLDFIEVPGREDPIIIDRESHSPIDVTFDVKLISDEEENLDQQIRRIGKWLRSSSDWTTLEFSGLQGVYLKAIHYEQLDVLEVLRNYGKAKIKFKCQPLKFKKSGDLWTECKKGTTFINHEEVSSKPLIYVKGRGSVKIDIGADSLEIKNIDNDIFIDCQTGEAWNNKGMQFDKIYTYPFPKLRPGRNVINWEGNVEDFQIKTRWVVL